MRVLSSLDIKMIYLQSRPVAIMCVVSIWRLSCYLAPAAVADLFYLSYQCESLISFAVVRHFCKKNSVLVVWYPSL